MSSGHKWCYSNHKLYHEGLKWTNLFVQLAIVYGTLLLAGALDVSGAARSVLVGLQEEPTARGEEGGGGTGALEAVGRRAGALGLATPGVMGLLVALLVSTAVPFVQLHVALNIATSTTQKICIERKQTV